MKTIILLLINFIYISTMAQQDFKVLSVSKINPLEYSFYEQNPKNLRICAKHKTKEEYYIISADGRYVIILNNKTKALDITLSDKNIDLGGLSETDSQEEIERITPENIEEKSKEILSRFNKNFKLNVDYSANEEEIDKIQERIKKTTWNKENKFLLNFYLMEVVKRRTNSQWNFQKIETFNPFYFPEYLEVLIGKTPEGEIKTMFSGKTFYSYLEKKKYFDLKYIIRISLKGNEFIKR